MMKERPIEKVGWRAPPPLRYAVQGFAPLRSGVFRFFIGKRKLRFGVQHGTQ